jgi:hypothetical protein
MDFERSSQRCAEKNGRVKRWLLLKRECGREKLKMIVVRGINRNDWEQEADVYKSGDTRTKSNCQARSEVQIVKHRRSHQALSRANLVFRDRNAPVSIGRKASPPAGTSTPPSEAAHGPETRLHSNFTSKAWHIIAAVLLVTRRGIRDLVSTVGFWT